jgi:8-oxo-dGTP pyrophosphatase MutT (NUDIX family)
MKHSCGALLYSYHPKTNAIGVILGIENNHWMPFKGCTKPNETFEETAKREVYEETCKLVHVENIVLENHFSSKNKHYHIGLVYADYSIIDKFKEECTKTDVKDYLEKKEIRFFSLYDLLGENPLYNLHSLTLVSIEFYKDKLLQLQAASPAPYCNLVSESDIVIKPKKQKKKFYKVSRTYGLSHTNTDSMLEINWRNITSVV